MQLDKLTLADLNWDQGAAPLSRDFDDFYFSTDNGPEEAHYVFVQHNHLARRFAALKSQQFFRIAETGFGSGLNFLGTLQLWQQVAPEEARLHFISFEKYPLSPQDLAKTHAFWPFLAELSAELRAVYPLLLPGWHDVWLLSGRVRLTLWFGDVATGLPELDAAEGGRVDAWFLDGFAPAKNPQMWHAGLYQQMARLSAPNATFATFTSAGEVRRGLQQAGFAVHKDSGYGKKREMCFGERVASRPFSSKAPWFSRPQPQAAGQALVVGAGLAGASVAWKLAEAGWRVTVLEAEKEPAKQASGNLAGAVHPLVTADWNLRSQWYLQGFEATLRTLLPWIRAGEVEADLNGLMQLAVTPTLEQRIKDALSRVGLPREFAYWLECEPAQARVGCRVSKPGLFFPQGGWVKPPSVVRRCLQHPNITVHYRQSVEGWQRHQNGWQVATRTACFRADAVVFATGALSEEIHMALDLPIRPVKGQVTHLTAEQQCQPLRCAVTHAGYSSPCGHGHAVTGATFEAPDMSSELHLASHQENLLQAAQALPDWLQVSAQQVAGRVAFRPTTPDHLPVVGPVADPHWLRQAYLTQSHTHAVFRYPEQRYLPGVFVSNGHGARGLMSVFLAAESIVADLQGEALRQPLALYQASHPARFAIRQWRSGGGARQQSAV